MKLPQFLLDSPFFQFAKLTDLEKALGDSVNTEELEYIRSLEQRGLPPVSSRTVLAAIFGINPGLVWSFEVRSHRYYRTFFIPKGRGQRKIHAPRVGLKIIQKWLSVQLQRCCLLSDHVYGFVANRSHVNAAEMHCGAKWVFSIDIQDFFQSTTQDAVVKALEELGYRTESARLIANLCCFKGALAQGAPSSPVISNICFRGLDEQLARLAERYHVKLTRYADDIVFSGTNDFPQALKEEVTRLFHNEIWQLSKEKTCFSVLPNRLIVHGLLVHGRHIRLTKGYRNKLRALRYLLAKGDIDEIELSKVQGHLNYGAFIEKISQNGQPSA